MAKSTEVRRAGAAGYSGTPLPKKLGIQESHRIALVNSPRGFARTLGELPPGVNVRRDLRGRGQFDVIHFFTREKRVLRRRFSPLARRLQPNGGLWVSWPKKSSGVETDLDEGQVRAIGLEAGLVDNKICAVDETWSALRFVIRLRDRPR